MKPTFKLLLACVSICCFALSTNNAQSSYSLEQLQQIRMVNPGPDLPAEASTTLKSSTTCEDIIYDYDDPVICSVPPIFGDLIEIVVGFNDCNFAPEVDNGDGTLTVQGLTLTIDPNGANIFVGTVLESATNGTSACGTTPLSVPQNTTCDPIVAEFGASVTTFVVDAVTGVISAASPNADCELELFTVTINPNLSAQIIESTADDCGSATVQLAAEDGTLCGDPVVATCMGDGEIELPLGETFGCTDNMQAITCANCPQPEVNGPADACNCDDGIDLDGDGAADILATTYTITDPGGAGQGWALTAVSGFVDGSNNVIMVPPPPDPPVLLPEDAANPGDYTFAVFVPADGTTTYSATFTSASGATLEISGGPCDVCEPAPGEPEVPTVGEWGLIILGLLMLIAAVVGIRQRDTEATQIG